MAKMCVAASGKENTDVFAYLSDLMATYYKRFRWHTCLYGYQPEIPSFTLLDLQVIRYGIPKRCHDTGYRA